MPGPKPRGFSSASVCHPQPPAVASGEWAGDGGVGWRRGIAHAADSAPVPFPALAPISPRGNAGGEKPVNLCLLFGFPLVIV